MKPTAALTRAINRFESACRNHAFRGAAHPDDWSVIEDQYWKARDNLVRVIHKYAAA